MPFPQYSKHLCVIREIFRKFSSYPCSYIAATEFSCYNIEYVLFYMDGVSIMSVSYKKLWKLLIDRDMKKKDLQRLSGVSPALIAKLGRNENVSTESLVKICTALGCDIGDIMEITPSKEAGANLE